MPWIYKHWGWEAAFILIGGLGFLWLICWLLLYQRPSKQKRLSAAELNYIQHNDEEPVAEINTHPAAETKVSWVKLLGYKQTWAFTFGKFMTDGVWWFFLFWLPSYLKTRGIIDEAVMLPLGVLYTMAMVGSIFGGWFPMYFIKKGNKVYDGRMKAMLVIALFPLVVLLAQPLSDISVWIPVVLIGIGASAHQAWSANIFTTVSDMFPQKAVGSVIGIGGMAGGVGGVAITKLGGALFDHYKALGHIQTGYSIMFSICAVAYLVAWVVMKSLVPKYNPITDL